ncbi:4-amino-4-deoxy-L-arabinose transferase [Oxalobacteraceae bacterium CAVE-383]|nr:4-amino-4-deoxy-L-arabinose transferase [Oxalobacteraceae bacterium CAVE-383]
MQAEPAVPPYSPTSAAPASVPVSPWRAFLRQFSPDAPSIAPLVVLILLGHLLLWTVLTGISHSAPDLDNMEELVWGNVFEWGYYKHPPLPSWLIYGLTRLLGRPVWLTFFAGQLSVVLALYFVWRLACEMTTQKNALIAVLLIMPITYFTTRGVISNHNTIQFWSIAGAIWFFYRAWRHRQMRDWLLLGLFSGFAMLTKYSALVQFAVFAGFLLIDGQLRHARTWKGIAAATGVLALMLAPHLWWMSSQAKTPIGYATHSLSREMTRAEHWQLMGDVFGTTAARLAPMLLVLIAIGCGVLWRRRAVRKTGAPVAAQQKIAAQLRPEDRRFILLVGLGPFVLTFLVVIVLKAPMIADWASTFYLLFGFFAFWLFATPPGDSGQLLRTCLKVVIVVQLATVIGYALARGPLSNMTGRATRANFPGAAISQNLQYEWISHTGTPLRLVASDTWLGGNIAIHAGPQVDVLIDGDIDKSQWVTAARAASCGMLLAINRSADSNDGTPPKVVEMMARAQWRGILELPATKKMDGPLLKIEWGIIPPTQNCPEKR